VTIDTSQNATFAKTANLPNTFGFKNRIINGAMVIDQRNAGASVTITAATSQFSVDRWNLVSLAASKFSVQQNAGAVTPPAGFKNYVGITSLSAYAVAATDIFAIRQSIEGYNIADLGWGAAGAQTVTLSFWVRSSLTGTFGGSLQNATSTQSYPFSYTISSANTWEQKSITIAGSTTATWEATSGMGMQVAFSVGSGATYSGTAGAWVASNIWSVTGATSVVGTSGATFYITGVQLEVGTVATSFDYRDYGRELMMCQRYYFKWTGASYATYSTGMGENTNQTTQQIIFPVQMRTAPTLAIGGANRVVPGPVSVTSTTINYSQLGNFGGYFGFTCAGAITQEKFYIFGANNDTSAFVSGSAEL
jgi:hypothetical protein